MDTRDETIVDTSMLGLALGNFTSPNGTGVVVLSQSGVEIERAQALLAAAVEANENGILTVSALPKSGAAQYYYVSDSYNVRILNMSPASGNAIVPQGRSVVRAASPPPENILTIPAGKAVRANFCRHKAEASRVTVSTNKVGEGWRVVAVANVVQNEWHTISIAASPHAYELKVDGVWLWAEHVQPFGRFQKNVFSASNAQFLWFTNPSDGDQNTTMNFEIG